MFGCRNCVAEGRIHDDHAPRSGRFDVHIVNTDAGAADDLEAGAGGDDVLVRLARGSDSQAVILPDDPDQLVFLEADLHVDFNAPIPEDVSRARREIVCDQNFHHFTVSAVLCAPIGAVELSKLQAPAGAAPPQMISGMTAHAGPVGNPGPPAVDLHLGVAPLLKVQPMQRREPVQQDHDVRRLLTDL